jgi:hypothetical protein
MSAATMVIYTGLLMAVTVGMTAWRLATVRGTVRTQVDGMLGACLVASGLLFVAAVLPGAQLP